MEMSGLVPERDRILEVAMVVTDANLDTIAEAPVYVLHQPEEVLEGMDSWNKATHGKSGLVDKVRASTFDEATVEARLIEFLKPIVGARIAPLAGNTVPVSPLPDRRRLDAEGARAPLASRRAVGPRQGGAPRGARRRLRVDRGAQALPPPFPAHGARSVAPRAAAHASAQPRARSTARLQPASFAAASSRPMCGSNTRSRFQSAAISASSFQKPVARPAR